MNDKFQSYLPAIVVMACLGLIGFLVHEKADGATVLAVATVTTLIGYFAKSPDKRDPPSGAVVVAGLFTAATILLACRIPTPKEEGAIVEAGCTLLEAFASSPAEQAICATVDELVGMGADVRAARADAGVEQKAGRLGRASGKCQIIPKTTVCATEDELAFAIKARRGMR